MRGKGKERGMAGKGEHEKERRGRSGMDWNDRMKWREWKGKGRKGRGR